MTQSFYLPNWPAPGNVGAAITTRRGGVSVGAWQSFNLATHVGDDPAHVAANRQQLQELALPVAPIWLEQVHSADVVRLTSEAPRLPPIADAACTGIKNVVCTVLTADCLPVLLCDKAGTQVAAVHAGWRGLAAGIVRNTLAAMAVEGREVLAYLGPAIGAAAFEVGAEVQEVFAANALDKTHRLAIGRCFVAGAVMGKFHADLYALARAELQALGVDAVYGGDSCTFNDAVEFYSYRRDGVTGRMASLIWLKS